MTPLFTAPPLMALGPLAFSLQHLAFPPSLAQGLDNVPASFLKNTLMVALAFCVGAGAFAAIIGLFRRKAGRTDRGTMVRSDAFDAAIHEVNRRLDGHEQQIDRLWSEMREEDKHIRAALAQAIRDFEGATERLQGTLEEVKATTAALLEKALERER